MDCFLEKLAAVVAQSNRKRSTESLPQVSFERLADSLAQLPTRCKAPMLYRQADEIYNVLESLDMDELTRVTGPLVPFVTASVLDLDAIRIPTPSGATLMEGVLAIGAIEQLSAAHKHPLSGLQKHRMRQVTLAMVQDIRCIIIKLSAQIAWLKSLKEDTPSQQMKAALICQQFYVPLANRLGIGQLQWELEDLCFRYLDTSTYHHLAVKLQERRVVREAYIQELVSELNQLLKAHDLTNISVYGRPKHLYSIWKKMQRKGLPLEDLFDVRAIRILVRSVEEGYNVLSLIHAKYPCLPSEFDDYIAYPKANGYQSIHTVIVGPEQKPVELQIRTYDMHERAERGIAAHWQYKEAADYPRYILQKGSRLPPIPWREMLIQILENPSGSTGTQLKDQKQTVPAPQLCAEDRCYVFTPEGEIVDLPTGATPLDFAYYIHTELGHHCIGAKIFGRIVPFSYTLKTGDQVEILTQRNAQPSPDWLNPARGFLRTKRARSKVKTFFKTMNKEPPPPAGKAIFECLLQRLGITRKSVPEHFYSLFHLESAEQFFLHLGTGQLKQQTVAQQLQEACSSQTTALTTRTAHPDQTIPKVSKPPSHATCRGLIVAGASNILHTLARCCQPIHGEAIGGFVTKTRGISIHLSSCPCFIKQQARSPDRIVEVAWPAQTHHQTIITLMLDCCLTALQASNLFSATLQKEQLQYVELKPIDSKSMSTYRYYLRIKINTREEIGRLLRRFEQLPGIKQVKRIVYH